MSNLVVHDWDKINTCDPRDDSKSLRVLPCLEDELSVSVYVSGCILTSSERCLLGSIAANLPWRNVGCIAVLVDDLWVKYLLSHDVDGVWAEQGKWF